MGCKPWGSRGLGIFWDGEMLGIERGEMTVSLESKMVSIVMPAYNSEKYIREAITSVIQQTYSDWELIVVDDGSKDNTVEIIEDFSKKDSRVKLHRNEKNLGVSATRNKGISLAVGEWIAFLDSDDMWDQTKLEKQINFAKDKDANFLFTGSAFINEKSESYSGIFNVPEQVSYKELLKQNVISCSSVLIKKHFLDTVKMEKDEIHEDYGAWLRILKKEKFAYGINESLLIYRISSGTKSSNKFKSLKMTYKTYRFVGISPLKASYYWCWYVVKSLRKYKKIY
jgi:teichuronic acid biosynthesis glycosyltransferase TuaG